MRAKSAARFREEDPSLLIADWPTKTGAVRIEFRTRYTDPGLGVRIPEGMWIDARGGAPSLDEARDAYREAAGVLGVLISFSANAAMQVPNVHIAFDNTPGLSERDYYSAALWDDGGLPLPGRRVNAEATVALLAAFVTHTRGPRLHRAVGQYAHALSHWTPGLELLAVAHLYMGIDALTKVVLANELQSGGHTSNQSLAQQWGIDVRQLDSEIRRRIIFKGDGALHDEVNDISNSFEHGFVATPELLSRATVVRNGAAGYLRSAILRSSGIDSATENLLLAQPYSVPQPMYPITAALRGKIRSDTGDWAAPSEQYPLIEWEPVISSAERIGSSQLRMNLEAKIKSVSLAEGASFLPLSVEYYGPESDHPLVDGP